MFHRTLTICYRTCICFVEMCNTEQFHIFTLLSLLIHICKVSPVTLRAFLVFCLCEEMTGLGQHGLSTNVNNVRMCRKLLREIRNSQITMRIMQNSWIPEPSRELRIMGYCGGLNTSPWTFFQPDSSMVSSWLERRKMWSGSDH